MIATKGVVMNKSDKLFDFIEEALKENCTVSSLQADLDRNFGETCAALVMDSTGFTRSTKTLGAAYFLSIISHLRKVCEKVATHYKAIDHRAHADNFYAEFKNVDLAVAMAFALHKHFDENPIPLQSKDDKFGVCIGIGYGKVVRSEHEGVYGNEMNYAAKLGEDTADRGETLLTVDAFSVLSNPESFDVSKRHIKVSGIEMDIYSIKPKG
jgi:adenylate cyclase